MDMRDNIVDAVDIMDKVDGYFSTTLSTKAHSVHNVPAVVAWRNTKTK
jgi:hypothetical protein